MVDYPLGKMYGRQALALRMTDSVIHTWDLARATGQSETLDSDQLQRMIAGLGAMPEEALRADGMFGPRIDVPADADDQSRFLGYVGRRA